MNIIGYLYGLYIYIYNAILAAFIVICICTTVLFFAGFCVEIGKFEVEDAGISVVHITLLIMRSTHIYIYHNYLSYNLAPSSITTFLIYLHLQTLKSNMEAHLITIACQIRHFYVFLSKIPL
jgi:hypothetical protein